jgi:DNA topoisomerase II
LKARGYTRFSDFTKVKSTKGQSVKKEEAEAESEEEAKEESESSDDSKEYNYLLSMPLWNLSYEKVEEIKKQARDKKNELLALEKTTIQ